MTKIVNREEKTVAGAAGTGVFVLTIEGWRMGNAKINNERDAKIIADMIWHDLPFRTSDRVFNLLKERYAEE